MTDFSQMPQRLHVYPASDRAGEIVKKSILCVPRATLTKRWPKASWVSNLHPYRTGAFPIRSGLQPEKCARLFGMKGLFSIELFPNKSHEKRDADFRR
jgi:hypothetical protein